MRGVTVVSVTDLSMPFNGSYLKLNFAIKQTRERNSEEYLLKAKLVEREMRVTFF